MNYKKVYDSIIEMAKNRILENDTYYEVHHIKPKCMNGPDNEINKVKLTYREHFVCHWLLYREYPDNIGLSNSFHIMAFVSKKYSKKYNYTPSSRVLEEAKITKINSMIGRKHSEETKQKISESHQKRKKLGLKRNYNTKTSKLIISEETKQKMREAKLGKKRNPELMKEIGRKIKENIDSGKRQHPMLGKKHSEESKIKMKNSQKDKHTGYKQSKETIKKREETRQKNRLEKGEGYKAIYKKRKSISEETRKKLSEAHKGKKRGHYKLNKHK